LELLLNNIGSHHLFMHLCAMFDPENLAQWDIFFLNPPFQISKLITERIIHLCSQPFSYEVFVQTQNLSELCSLIIERYPRTQRPLYSNYYEDYKLLFQYVFINHHPCESSILLLLSKILQYDSEINSKIGDLFLDVNDPDLSHTKALREGVEHSNQSQKLLNIKFVTYLFGKYNRKLEEIIIRNGLIDSCFDCLFSNKQRNNTVLHIIIIELVNILFGTTSFDLLIEWINNYSIISKIGNRIYTSNETISILPHVYKILEIIGSVKDETFVQFLKDNQEWNEITNSQFYNEMKAKVTVTYKKNI